MQKMLLGALLLFQGVAWGCPEPGGSPVNVRELSEGLWRVEVARSLSGREARAALQAVATGELDPCNPPHALAAGAMAWSMLAGEFMEAGMATEAMEAARQGIEELGDSYLMPVMDDSSQRLVAAEVLAADGRVSEGAAIFVGTLQWRIDRYWDLHEATLRRD